MIDLEVLDLNFHYTLKEQDEFLILKSISFFLKVFYFVNKKAFTIVIYKHVDNVSSN